MAKVPELATAEHLPDTFRSRYLAIYREGDAALRAFEAAIDALPLPVLPPRKRIWTGRSHALDELTHPLHLIAEGRAMSNCLAHPHYTDGSTMTSGIAAYARHSPYWHDVKKRQARPFSFGNARQPLLTIDVRITDDGPLLSDIRAKRNHRLTRT